MSKVCALVIGHKSASPGAVNAALGITEFGFNDNLAREIEARVKGVTVQRVYRRTYGTLPDDINELAPDFVVSLHCNAFDKRASGTEVLYYHRSASGQSLAAVLHRRLREALDLKDRGIRPKTSEDRGGYLLRRCKAPCVIAEPFFIDNDDDMARAMERHDDLADAYAGAIEEAAAI